MIKIFHRYSDKFVSKWMILIMDLFLVAVSFVFASTLRFNFDLSYHEPALFKYHLILVLTVRMATFFYLKTYTGVVRHTSLEDAKILFYAVLISSIELFLIQLIPFNGIAKFFQIPPSILLIDFFVLMVGLILSRLIIKSAFESIGNSFKTRKEIIIYGSGNLGRITKNTLLSDTKNKNEILCFIDDNPQIIGKKIEGIPVLSKKDAIQKLALDNNSKVEVIFAIGKISPSRKADIVDDFLEIGVKMRVVPPVKQWINGQLSIQQIQNVKIEDLLERPSIQINNRIVKSFLFGKKIFITGAAGSIGSEIVRQVLQFQPAEVVLIDQAESPLYDIETELLRLKNKENLGTKIFIEVKNITNAIQMARLFKKYQPNLVFHAAAYKHVPLMEDNPFKALEVNTLGTKLMADLATKNKVEKFVFISTDKAVNPTNVMGASKRLAEMYVQSLNQHHTNETRYIVTRFGNVLGSNGSVIPLFKKQIEKGGPVTVTDKDIIRYFMTIPEACQLVLEAGTMGKGGEIYVFDMGLPVRILDLAERMIKLSGFEPYTQIPIEFSGLRPGEKLFEELLNEDETTIGTHHPKIMVAKVKGEDYDTLNRHLMTFHQELNGIENLEIVRRLKQLVPEFISKNSKYEALDQLTSSDAKLG